MTQTNSLKWLVFTLLMVSCHNESDFDENDAIATNKVVAEKTIENGRFLFTSKAALQKTIDRMENEATENLEKEFERYYASGFRSHTPLVSENNETLQEQLSREIMQRHRKRFRTTAYGSTDFEGEDFESEQFIADPLFAAVVNQDNEIIVGDSIYKFTKDQGVFFAHRDDMDTLISHVDGTTASEGIAYSSKIEPCVLRAQHGGVTQVSDKVSRYIRRLDPGDDCHGGSGGGSPFGPVITKEQRLQNIISNLPECKGSRPFFQNIFGRTFVCRSYFDSKHRVKTEFWDQRWFIYASVGVQVKTQRKRFWIWWRSKSNEIHLGINRILLKYNYPQPKINSFSHPELFPKNSYKNPIYLWDGKFIVNFSDNSLNFIDVQLDLPSGNLPFFDFKKKDILNIYIPKLFKKGKYNINLTTADILSQSNIKGLYQMGIDFLKNSNGFNSGSLNTPFVITYQKDYDNIEVLYFGERYKKSNDNRIKRKFYSNTSFLIGGAWSNKGGWSFSLKSPSSFFRNYTHYDIDFYGMARRGRKWRGNRMIRKK